MSAHLARLCTGRGFANLGRGLVVVRGNLDEVRITDELSVAKWAVSLHDDVARSALLQQIL